MHLWTFVFSSCSDKQESSRTPGLYFSFQGCKGILLEEPQPHLSEPQIEQPSESVDSIEAWQDICSYCTT